MGVPCALQPSGRHAERIGSLSQKYVWGTFPPKPKIDRAIMLDERHGDGYTIRNLRLEFGPESKGIRAREHMTVQQDGIRSFMSISFENIRPQVPRSP